MILTLGNGKIWLGAPPVVLQFYFCILPLCGPANASSRKAFVSFSFWHWDNERMLLTMHVFEKNYFLLGT